MGKLIIVSNRLPVSIEKKEGDIVVTPSVGGLATGMKSVYKSRDGIWVGWPGLSEAELTNVEKESIAQELKEEKCKPVYLDEEDRVKFYDGFSNKTIWPLFHYFTQYTEYDEETWEAYTRVNRVFAEAVLVEAKEGDTIWIHDYQLFLMPAMIREKYPRMAIGFFLHIPFPSFEVFRLLPWRKEIIEGMLGADLIGFHTYDYLRHFSSCVRRLCGYDVDFNRVTLEDRVIRVDAFPMGIDYDKFHEAALAIQKTSESRELNYENSVLALRDKKMILSIDRLDYSKGIARRLLAYEQFLEQYPEYIEKVFMLMVAVPSRTDVEEYQLMKNRIEQAVGRINGRFGTLDWTPVLYFYRSFDFNKLVEFYSLADIALITPVRDGMNLIAKEYLATKLDGKGVLILSEMAGVAKEMGETIIVNPNNIKEMATAIRTALEMPVEEQVRINRLIQNRIKRYDVITWASDFMNNLLKIKNNQSLAQARKFSIPIRSSMLEEYKKAKKRIILLDYDGTLVGFKPNPLDARPDDQLMDLLSGLAAGQGNHLVIISGRDKDSLNEWFAGLPLTLVGEHGVWIRYQGKDWEMTDTLQSEWKEQIRGVLESYVDRTPGSLIEEKSFSLVWHYRKAEPEFGSLRAWELKEELLEMIANHNLQIMEGNKVLEIKPININKGKVASTILASSEHDFVLGIGDDWTDEYLFEAIKESSWSIKVGTQTSHAKYTIESVAQVRELLLHMLES
jgi:trehalose 6-phosphate synthase/phosphatase